MTATTAPVTTPPARPALGGPRFGGLTDRMEAWRDELLSAEPSVCVERAVITTDTYRDNADQPLVMIRAQASTVDTIHQTYAVVPFRSSKAAASS